MTPAQAMREALDAGLDFPRKLRLAQVLDGSDNPTHRTLADHIRCSASLHEAGLLKPISPRDELVNRWHAEKAKTPTTMENV